MKRFLVCLGLLAAAATLSAQHDPSVSPATVEKVVISGKAIEISYNAPGVKGRAGHLFGKDGRIGSDPQYPIWRAGANTATKLHTDADLEIGSLKVPKGDYSLFIDLTDPAHWVLIVNKQTGQWGLSYDKTQDLGSVKLDMEAPSALVERLKYTIEDKGAGKAKLSLAWENLCGSVTVVAH